MTHAKRKAFERARFELFRTRLGLLSNGTVSQPSPPDPDIVVTTQHGVIGVELTELVTNRKLREQEAEQDGIVAAAQVLHEKEGLPCIGAEFHWKEGHLIRKSDREPLAASIAQVVASHVPELGQDVILDRSSEATEYFNHPAFDRIWLNRIIEYDENLWDSPRAWWTGRLVPENVQSVIDQKDSRLRHYRTLLAERWLLITSDGIAPSSGFRVEADVWNHTYHASFDRVFLAVFSFGGIRELKTTRA